MDAFMGIIAALIAVTGALIGALLARRSDRAADHRKEIRLAVAGLTRSLGAGSHSIEWFVWIAKFTPDKFNGKSIDRYNQEMHEVLPKIVGDLAVISALSAEMFKKMQPLAAELYQLDHSVAHQAARFQSEPEDAVKRVAGYMDEAAGYNEGLNRRVARILEALLPE